MDNVDIQGDSALDLYSDPISLYQLNAFPWHCSEPNLGLRGRDLRLRLQGYHRPGNGFSRPPGAGNGGDWFTGLYYPIFLWPLTN